jgi:plasmid maintenance system antidote protein VapI
MTARGWDEAHLAAATTVQPHIIHEILTRSRRRVGVAVAVKLGRALALSPRVLLMLTEKESNNARKADTRSELQRHGQSVQLGTESDGARQTQPTSTPVTRTA